MELIALSMALGLLTGLCMMVINILFAVGVRRDIGKQAAEGRGTVFVGSFAWTVGTLFGGIFVAIAYWLLHHSSLAREDGTESRVFPGGLQARMIVAQRDIRRSRAGDTTAPQTKSS